MTKSQQLLGLIFCIGLLVLMLVWQCAAKPVQGVPLEVAKTALGVMGTTVVGGIIAEAIKRRDEEHAEAANKKEEENRERERRQAWVRDTHTKLQRAYHGVRKTRSQLSGLLSPQDAMIARAYPQLLERLLEYRLIFDEIRRSVVVEKDRYELHPELEKSLNTVDDYLRAILTEYEETAPMPSLGRNAVFIAPTRAVAFARDQDNEYTRRFKVPTDAALRWMPR